MADISSITLPSGSTYNFKDAELRENAEVTSNKVTSISASSTDTQYPSAKCMYDIFGDVETLLAAI